MLFFRLSIIALDPSLAGGDNTQQTTLFPNKNTGPHSEQTVTKTTNSSRNNDDSRSPSSPCGRCGGVLLRQCSAGPAAERRESVRVVFLDSLIEFCWFCGMILPPRDASWQPYFLQPLNTPKGLRIVFLTLLSGSASGKTAPLSFPEPS